MTADAPPTVEHVPGGGIARRRFLQGAVALGVAGYAGSWGERLAAAAEPTPDRMVVHVLLNGGNDPLNTLVPLGDSRYTTARGALAVPAAQATPLGGAPAFGLHRSFEAVRPLWDAGQLAFVPRVGFPDPTRSHFEMLDRCWTGRNDHTLDTGWLGRWLDLTGASTTNPLTAIALGHSGHRVLRSETTATTAVHDLGNFAFLQLPPVRSAMAKQGFLAAGAPTVADSPLLAEAREAVAAAGRTVDTVTTARPGATGSTGTYTEALGTAANLLSMGLGTKAIVVAGNGFDTHADQALTHAGLLADLGQGLSDFWSVARQQGIDQRCLVLVTSEFGRRVAANGSAGTDHGKAGMAMLVGPGVSGGVYGDHGLGDLDDGDLRAVVDPRSAYAAGLDWVGAASADVLGGTFDHRYLV